MTIFYPCQPVMIEKWVTWNDLELLFHLKIHFRPALFDSERLTLKLIALKVTNIDPCYQWQKCRSVTLVSGFWQYKLFLDIRRCFLQERRQTWVGSLKSTNLPFSCCYIFVSFRNNISINCMLRRHAVLDFCRGTNKDDLEWPWMHDST